MKRHDLISVMKLLETIIEANSDDHGIKHIILWSDSSIPENRSSLFATVVKVFLKHHPGVLSIEQKNSSTVQELNNLHSHIEQVCGNSEIYSPVGLLRMPKRLTEVSL